jgi:hypothetical protein
MFGSLVFCLPTEFTGGELIIRSPDLSTSITHDWGSTSISSGSSGYGVAWAAMYSDCERWVKPVITGHRVTLTYNLYKPADSEHSSRQDSCDAATASTAAAASTARESAFGEQLAAALSDATWYPAEATLGFALESFYAEEPLSTCLTGDDDSGTYAERSCNMPASIEPDSLKGADLQLYRAAKALGLEIKIVPVVSLDRFLKFEMKYATYDDEDASANLLPPSKLAVVKSFKNCPAYGRWDRNKNSWAAFLQKELAQDRAQITGDLLWVKPPGKQHLKYCKDVSRYPGNDGPYSFCTTCYHAAAALLVVVPPVGAAARQG